MVRRLVLAATIALAPTYCRGVGLVKDGDLELTAIYRNPR
jgi:hypothetical protein